MAHRGHDGQTPDLTPEERSASLFELVLTAAPDATVVVDMNGTIVLANAHAETIFGYSQDELVGQKVEILLPDSLRENHVRLRTRFAEAPYRRDMGSLPGLHARRSDGSYFPIELSLAPVDTGDDQLVIASVRDVTEALQLAEAVELSRAFSDRVLEAAPDATVVMDAHGEIVLANSEAASIFDYAREELIGKSVTEILPPSVRDVHVTHRVTLEADPERQVMCQGLDLLARRPNGTTFPVEISLSPLTMAGQEMVIASIRDVTEQRQLEWEVERSRSLFERVLESAPDATVVVDAEGKIVLANEQIESIFGYSRSELLGECVELLVPEARRDSHIRHRAAFAEDPRVRRMGSELDLRGRRADGSEFPAEMSLAPLRSGDDNLVIASVCDVSERRRMARDLERSNQDLRQFAYLASHDLQAPLRTVAGFTELLVRSLSETGLTEDQIWLATNVEDGVVRMQRLIRDLLAYSRIDATSKPSAIVPVAHVVEQVLLLLASDISELNADITIDTPDSVIADPGQLRQVLQNLIQNSLLHRSRSRAPEIAVRSYLLPDAFVRVSVADNGEGIPSEHREAVFEMFKQLKAGREGTGIGLAVVKRIVERHGGTVYVDPEPKQGTTVLFTLPAAASSAEPDEVSLTTNSKELPKPRQRSESSRRT